MYFDLRLDSFAFCPTPSHERIAKASRPFDGRSCSALIALKISKASSTSLRLISAEAVTADTSLSKGQKLLIFYIHHY